MPAASPSKTARKAGYPTVRRATDNSFVEATNASRRLAPCPRTANRLPPTATQAPARPSVRTTRSARAQVRLRVTRIAWVEVAWSAATATTAVTPHPSALRELVVHANRTPNARRGFAPPMARAPHQRTSHTWRRRAESLNAPWSHRARWTSAWPVRGSTFSYPQAPTYARPLWYSPERSISLELLGGVQPSRTAQRAP